MIIICASFYFFTNVGAIYFPLKDQDFSTLRCKFGSTFYAARCAIEKRDIDPEKMRRLLSDCFPHKSEFNDENLKTVHEILDAVKKNCNLIDINCLEVVVIQFNVAEAIDPLEVYKAEVQEFCKQLRNELNESLEVVRNPKLLSRETIVLVLDQTPLVCTVGDIKDVVREALGASLEEGFLLYKKLSEDRLRETEPLQMKIEDRDLIIGALICTTIQIFTIFIFCS